MSIRVHLLGGFGRVWIMDLMDLCYRVFIVFSGGTVQFSIFNILFVCCEQYFYMRNVEV